AAGIVEPERVRGADGHGRGLALVRLAEGRFLVRDGDVASGQTLGRERAEEGFDLLRRHGALRVAAVDLVAVEPIAMARGGARVLDGPADDAGAFHATSTSRRRSSARSGRSGSPRMVVWSPSTCSNNCTAGPSIW